MVDEFLIAYAARLDWTDTDPNVIARKLCSQAHYSLSDRDFLLIYYGWHWGKTGNEVEANCYSALLKSKMDGAYTQVARENNW